MNGIKTPNEIADTIINWHFVGSGVKVAEFLRVDISNAILHERIRYEELKKSYEKYLSIGLDSEAKVYELKKENDQLREENAQLVSILSKKRSIE